MSKDLVKRATDPRLTVHGRAGMVHELVEALEAKDAEIEQLMEDIFNLDQKWAQQEREERRRAEKAEAEVERLREALRFIQDMPYKSGPDNHLGRASDIAKQALADQQAGERESDAVSSTVYESAVEGRRSFRTLYRQARDALKETRRHLRKNRLSWNGPQFQAVWTINTALNEQPPEDQPGGISPAQPDPRDAVVEAARLRSAIQTHRDHVWGNGTVRHEADRELYAALDGKEAG